MVNYQESIIPKSVWKFVKGMMKHPIKAGILALIISNFLSKNEPKKSVENYREVLKSLAEKGTLEFTYKGVPLLFSSTQTGYYWAIGHKIMELGFKTESDAIKASKKYIDKNG